MKTRRFRTEEHKKVRFVWSVCLAGRERCYLCRMLNIKSLDKSIKHLKGFYKSDRLCLYDNVSTEAKVTQAFALDFFLLKLNTNILKKYRKSVVRINQVVKMSSRA